MSFNFGSDGTVYERHEPALAAALAALQRALLDGADANTAAAKLAALVRALGADSQVTASATSTTSTEFLSSSPTPLHDRTYEDILATAIVNKVISYITLSFYSAFTTDKESTTM